MWQYRRSWSWEELLISRKDTKMRTIPSIIQTSIVRTTSHSRLSEVEYFGTELWSCWYDMCNGGGWRNMLGNLGRKVEALPNHTDHYPVGRSHTTPASIHVDTLETWNALEQRTCCNHTSRMYSKATVVCLVWGTYRYSVPRGAISSRKFGNSHVCCICNIWILPGTQWIHSTSADATEVNWWLRIIILTLGKARFEGGGNACMNGSKQNSLGILAAHYIKAETLLVGIRRRCLHTIPIDCQVCLPCQPSSQPRFVRRWRWVTQYNGMLWGVVDDSDIHRQRMKRKTCGVAVSVLFLTKNMSLT